MSLKPAFVLGIDGLPYTLTEKLVQDGVMPNMGKLASSGSLKQMDTTVPDFSCVAWTSFATGVNPGKHGIYGFQDFHPTTAENHFTDVTNCRSKQLWHSIGDVGGRTVVLNLPGTYPAMPLRGKMVSGFVAPDFKRSCYPATFYNTLKALNYRMDLDGRGGLGAPNHVEECIFPVFEARKDAIRHIIKNEYWDLCIAVITETDRLQHYFLHCLDDQNHPKHEWTLSLYRKLDEFIGEVVELLGDEADLYMVSDHGFNVVKQDVVLEDLLRDIGLAVESKEQCWKNPDTAAKTQVFTLDPGRFYINRNDSRFPYGFVKEKEIPEIIDRICGALNELRDKKTGSKIVNSIRTKEEGFWGEALDYAPDLVAATNPGYYFKSYRYPSDSGVKEMKWEANHVWNDAIFYAPLKLDKSYRPVIWDVLPNVIKRMGLDVPENTDATYY